mgnify:FL=1|jgi:hypothetical protein
MKKSTHPCHAAVTIDKSLSAKQTMVRINSITLNLENEIRSEMAGTISIALSEIFLRIFMLKEGVNGHSNVEDRTPRSVYINGK